jgi:hypothetical protein
VVYGGQHYKSLSEAARANGLILVEFFKHFASLRALKATGFVAQIERTWTSYRRYPWSNQSHRREAESGPP